MQTSEAIHPEKNGQGKALQTHRSLGNLTRHSVKNNIHIFECDCANVGLHFVNDAVLRVKIFPTQSENWTSSIAVLKSAQAPVPVSVEENGAAIVLATPLLKVEVQKAPFGITVYTADGVLVYDQVNLLLDSKGGVSCAAQTFADGHFYGLGEKTSYLDKRGERYENWNTDVYAPHVPEIEALYVSIPYLVHKHGDVTYGVFLDNPGRTIFDMRAQADQFTFSTVTGDFDFYIIYGPTLKDVTTRYTALTGRMNIPPKWALGYHQSRYSYMDENEVLDLARTFRAKELPCDVIHLDIHYMNEYRVFTFDPVRFPDPNGMMQQLGDMGFNVVPIVDPGVKKDANYTAYQEGIRNDYFCKRLEGDVFFGDVWPGTSAFPDFTEDSVGKWWGNSHRFYTDMGIRGIWNDMNEPAVFNESKTMDLDVMHLNNGNPKTHEELHNLYGMLMSKATYEGLKEQLDGERPFVLTRASYAGIQRYAALWTGDNRSFWEHMQMAMPMVLNLGLSGVAFSGPDIGGFAHHTSGELLTRWLQMGVFFPFCRNHSALDTVRQEPWSFGEPFESINRKYLNLRYQLMPYLYTLFYEASQTGLPVMRPLVLEYPQDPVVTNLCDQFLVGTNLLVAPVYRPDTEVRAVYLPAGVWYDYWTGERFDGGRHILAHAPLDTLPMYVKAGSVIPLQTIAQFAGNEDPRVLRLEVYAGGSTTYQLYEDDGRTFTYQNGQYNLLDVDYTESAGEAKLRLKYAHKGYETGRQKNVIVLKHFPFEPSNVTGLERLAEWSETTTSEGWHYLAGEQTLVLQMREQAGPVSIQIS